MIAVTTVRFRWSVSNNWKFMGLFVPKLTKFPPLFIAVYMISFNAFLDHEVFVATIN